MKTRILNMGAARQLGMFGPFRPGLPGRVQRKHGGSIGRRFTCLLFCLFLLVLCAGAAHAQTQAERDGLPTPARPPARLHFEHLTVADGLPQGSVYAIHQDRRGFMWFGTQAGLSRYDGYSFTTYGTVPFDSTSFQGGWVTSIAEDREGMLWIGTLREGVSRFDPATGTFERYPHVPGDSTALTSSWVWDILVDRSGAIWISTGQGLTCLDPATGDYTRYFHDPKDPHTLTGNVLTTLYEDASGRLWIGSTSGLNRLDPRTGRVTRYLFDPGATPSGVTNVIKGRFIHSNVAVDIYTDPEDPGILWITGKGLIRFDTRTGEHTRYLPDPLHPDVRARNVTKFIAPDPQASHILWMTTHKLGLLRFDKHTGQFTRYRHDPDDPNSLSANNLYYIHTDRTGTIWVSEPPNGLNRFDPHAGGMAHYRHVPGDPNSLSVSSTWSIFEDDSGTLWIGSAGGGLNRIDRETGEVTHYRHDPNDPTSISGNAVFDIYEDRSGTLWVGTNSGLDKMNRTTGTFTHYRHDPQDSTSLTAGTVYVILEDRAGTLWIGTGQGLNRMDRQTGTFTRFVHDPSDAASLSGSSVYSLYEDLAGTLWAGTGNGLNRMDRATGTFTRYTYDPERPNGISSGNVISIHERASEPGVLWIGLAAGGLDRFDTRTGIFTHYTEEDGLPDNLIYGILEDGQGRLWMSTNNGLSRFDPETETFKNYGLESGLQALEFNGWAYFKNKSGKLFFGGVNGVNAFYPEQLQGNMIPPQVAITGFELFNRPVAPGPESPLRAPLAEANEIRLEHDQNSVTFKYVGLHYADPEENRYAYMLEGFDEGWVQAGTRRTATYTNLDPGNYTFKVKAANSDGVWSKETATIQLAILPPWWRTWWAYAFYGLVFAAGVFGVDRFQRRRLLKKEREEARERELAQAKEIEEAYEKLEASHQKLEEAHRELEASHREVKAAQAQLVQQEKMAALGELTAGIAHEIKNPLNFVNNFAALSEELAEEAREALGAPANGANPQRREEIEALLDDLRLNAGKIEEHGRRADGIVRSMLLHSRGQSDERRETDLNALVEEYVNLAYHGTRAQTPDFNATIERDYDETVGSIEVVPQELGRVFINLLNNAFYAVHEQTARVNGQYAPRVSIRTRKEGEQVEIRVKDNGPGIPDEVREKVFEPFFTTKPTGEGTGLGLSMSYDIVTQGHGGALTVESEEGRGTTFVITLPSHARADEAHVT